MNWNRIAVAVEIVLGSWVVIRLLRLNLHAVYKLFCAFVVLEVAASSLALTAAVLSRVVDYRILWLALAAPSWVITLWMVYSLLGAVLSNLRGLLSLSHRLLRVTFMVAALVAVLLVRQVAEAGPRAQGPLGKLLLTAIDVERAVGVVALLVLVGVSVFMLWFPVQLARNLVVFTAGLTVYFLFRTASALGVAFLPPAAEHWLSWITLVVLPGCYAYWALTISAKGELAMVRIGQSWNTDAKRQLALMELERMNAHLLRSLKN